MDEGTTVSTDQPTVSADHTRDRPVVIQVMNSLERAGAERVSVDLARRLDPGEFDVHVVVVRDGPLREYVEDEGLHLYRTGYDFDRTAIIALTKMTLYFRTVRPQIVHTHLLGSDIIGRLAALLAGVPVIVSTQHDMLSRPWYWTAYKRLTARATTTVACSRQVLKYCRTVIRVPEGRLHRIDNGIDAELFSQVAHPRREPITFGAIGSLTRVKGHRVLIEAFARVVGEMPDARLVIAGEGVERARLEALVARLGLEGSVELPGVVHDIPDHLGRIDIYVHPSLNEGLPMALLEAMAAARPCITTTAASLPEVVDCPHAGACVPPGDPQALADEMLALARDTGRAEALGQRARKRVRERYSLDRAAEQYAGLYRELLAGVEYVTAPVGVPREPRWWRATASGLRVGLLGTLLFFIVQALAAGFSELQFDRLRIDAPQLLLSVVLLGLYYALFVGGLTLLFRAGGNRAPYSEVFKVSFMANLAKYLPGGVWPVAARAAMAGRLRMSRMTAVMLSVAESAASVAGGAVVMAVPGILAIEAPGISVSSQWIALGMAVVLLAMLPHLLSGRFLALLHGTMPDTHEPMYRGYVRSAALVLYYAGTWLVAGAAFRTLVASVAGDPGAGWLAYSAYYAFASVVGLLVLFAPGGIGAREGALMLALSGPLGAPIAAVIAIVARLWSTLTELAISGIALAMPHRQTHPADESEAG